MRVYNNGSKTVDVYVDQLLVDRTYQRYVQPPKVLKIAQGFNWLAFGYLTLSQRGSGQYVILDGQSRFLGLLHHYGGVRGPDGKVIGIQAEVRKCKNRKEEGDLFILMNELQKSLGPNDFFHAGAFVGNPMVLAIVDTLDRYGMRVAYGPDRTGPNETRQAGAMMHAYRTLGQRKFGFLARVLATCYTTHGVVEKAALTAAFLRGLVVYLDETKETYPQVLLHLRGTQSAASVLGLATNDPESGLNGWARKAIVAKHIGRRVA